MVFQEQIIDFGNEGLLLLTLSVNGIVTFPSPAHSHGYAQFIPSQGPPMDRFGLFTRQVSEMGLRSILDHQMKFLNSQDAIYWAEAKARYSQKYAAIIQGYREAASGVYPLSNGLALVVFSGVMPNLIRIVDVVKNVVCSEEDSMELTERLAMKVPTRDRGLVMPDIWIQNYYTEFFHAWIGNAVRVCRITENALQLAGNIKRKEFDGAIFTKSFAISKSGVHSDATLIPLSSSDQKRTYTSALAKKHGFAIIAARNANRFACLLGAGVIEIVDCNAGLEKVLRPVPSLHGKEGGHFVFSPNGRFAVMLDSAGSVIVDIDLMRVANISTIAAVFGIATDAPLESVRYLPTSYLSDFGFYELLHKNLQFTPHDSLQWRPLEEYNPNSRKTKPVAALRDFADANFRFAISVKAARKKTDSKFYGTPRVADLAAWPTYMGALLLPFAELDCAQLQAEVGCKELPHSGALLVFLAIDDEGAPLEDDEFNPVHIHVQYTEAPASCRYEFEGMPTYGAQAILFKTDQSNYPGIESTIVSSANFNDETLEQYRLFLDKKLPDGVSEDHRLGGYPFLIQNDDLDIRAYAKHFGHSPRNAAELTEAARWRLLMQIDSDDNFMWGTDSGMLYLMIHEDDLAVLNFSKVIAITDGY